VLERIPMVQCHCGLAYNRAEWQQLGLVRREPAGVESLPGWTESLTCAECGTPPKEAGGAPPGVACCPECETPQEAFEQRYCRCGHVLTVVMIASCVLCEADDTRAQQERCPATCTCICHGG
jgi:hypothetical protein